MRRLFIMVLLVALAATVTYPQKKIRIRPAEKYSAKKKQDGVTLAVQPYHTVRETRRAFGTEMISTYGVLPILVVLHNSSSHILNLNTMKTRLITSDREGLEPLTEKELMQIKPIHTPKKQTPGKAQMHRSGGNNPPIKQTASSVIGDRIFTAVIAPPKSTVSGFFFYKIGYELNSLTRGTVYISEIRNLTTGKRLASFEIELKK